MIFTHLSFINETHQFDPCPDCNEGSQYRCKTCYGTGRLCPDCYNTGIKKGGNSQDTFCDCGIRNQKVYLEELHSLNLQKLVNVPEKYDGSVEDIESNLRIIAESNYRHVTKSEFVYSRFVFTSTREEKFILARHAYLVKSQAMMKPSDSLRGFVYVDALQFSDTSYVDAISHNLSHITFPYLSHITKNLYRPAYFFATPEWFESYKFLRALWIDKKWKAEE